MQRALALAERHLAAARHEAAHPTPWGPRAEYVGHEVRRWQSEVDGLSTRLGALLRVGERGRSVRS